MAPSTINVATVTIMTPLTCKAARAGLDIPVRELARRADVAANTLLRFERGEELRARTVKAIQTVLEAAGATFLEPDDAGPGLRLRPRAGAEAPVSAEL